MSEHIHKWETYWFGGELMMRCLECRGCAEPVEVQFLNAQLARLAALEREHEAAGALVTDGPGGGDQYDCSYCQSFRGKHEEDCAWARLRNTHAAVDAAQAADHDADVLYAAVGCRHA